MMEKLYRSQNIYASSLVCLRVLAKEALATPANLFAEPVQTFPSNNLLLATDQKNVGYS